MGWAEKAIKKYQQEQEQARKRAETLQMIEDIMNTPEYKEARKIDMEDMLLNAIARFVFNSLIYLEQKFRCKKQGLMNFIVDFKEQLKEIDINDDEDFYVASNQYYIDKYGIDVIKELGLVAMYEEKGNKLVEKVRKGIDGEANEM